MNPFELLEKLINEHGSANILREHLTQVRAQYADLQRAHDQAEAKAKELQAQLDEANASLKDAQAQLARLQGGLLATHVCAHCGSANVRRVGTRPHPTFGEVGLREAVLRCEECEGTTYVELPLA